MIYLDLDGVFADFQGAIVKHTGINNYKDDPKGVWEKLEKVPYLFRTLDPIPGSKDLFDAIVKKHGEHNVQMLTALPLLTGLLTTAAYDKTQWVRTHLSETIVVNCSKGWREKTNWCSGGDILIDDMQRNIIEWEQAGGTGVHHVCNESTRGKMKLLGLL